MPPYTGELIMFVASALLVVTVIRLARDRKMSMYSGSPSNDFMPLLSTDKPIRPKTEASKSMIDETESFQNEIDRIKHGWNSALIKPGTYKPYKIKAYPNANPGPCFEMPGIVRHSFSGTLFTAKDTDGKEYRMVSKVFIFEIDPMIAIDQ